MEALQARWSCASSLEKKTHGLERGSRSALSIVAPRAKEKEVPDQLTLRTSRSVAKPTKPSLDKLHRYTSEAEVAP